MHGIEVSDRRLYQKRRHFFDGQEAHSERMILLLSTALATVMISNMLCLNGTWFDMEIPSRVMLFLNLCQALQRPIRSEVPSWAKFLKEIISSCPNEPANAGCRKRSPGR